jgi:hypothetical protein
MCLDWRGSPTGANSALSGERQLRPGAETSEDGPQSEANGPSEGRKIKPFAMFNNNCVNVRAPSHEAQKRQSVALLRGTRLARASQRAAVRSTLRYRAVPLSGTDEWDPTWITRAHLASTSAQHESNNLNQNYNYYSSEHYPSSCLLYRTRCFRHGLVSNFRWNPLSQDQ